jgi:hypothetical protein
MCVRLACIGSPASANDPVPGGVDSIKSGNCTLSLAGNEDLGYGLSITADEHEYVQLSSWPAADADG